MDENPDLTAEARALDEYEPDEPAVRALLERYFHGDVSDSVVAGVHARAIEIFTNQGLLSGTNRRFERLTGYHGQAWVEEFVARRKTMTRSDLVLLVAAMRAKTDPGQPQPKLYCPDAYIGSWEQLEPDIEPGKQIEWHLAADGRFRADFAGDFRGTSSNVSDLKLWCVERGPGGPGVSLVLFREFWQPRGWSLWCEKPPSATEFAGEYLSYFGRELFRMRRIVQEKSR